MKKKILIFCILLTSFSLMAIGYLTWNNTDTESMCRKSVVSSDYLVSLAGLETDIDLVYKVGSRYNNTITKEKLENAKSITDIFSMERTRSIESYQAVEVVILHNDTETKVREIGDSDVFNAAQRNLLQSSDYSTNFYLSASCKIKNAYGIIRDDSLISWMTIIPENEAEYTSGYDELITYLRENSKEKTKIIKQDKVSPGKVSFTVTAKGTVDKVKLTSSSGYPSVDKVLIKLVNNIPGAWNPATNYKGEKVDQEFVFFFGSMGC